MTNSFNVHITNPDGTYTSTDTDGTVRLYHANGTLISTTSPTQSSASNQSSVPISALQALHGDTPKTAPTPPPPAGSGGGAGVPNNSLKALHGDTGPGGVDIATVTTFIGLQGQKNSDGNNALNYINPPTDPRLNSILARTGSPLVHGIIQQTDDLVTGGSDPGGKAITPQPYPYACRFMFNPPQVDISYSINPNVLPSSQLTASQLQATAFYPGSTSISFSLLFDRTYEVAYGKMTPFDADLQKIGVYADVAALEAVVGVRSARAQPQFDATGAKGAASAPLPGFNDVTGAILGNMVMTPVYIIFGGGKGVGDGTQGTAGLAFVATITGMSVTYGLFSQNMIPTRAGVQINATTLVGRDVSDINKKGGTMPNRLGQSNRVTTSNGGNYAPGQAPFSVIGGDGSGTTQGIPIFPGNAAVGSGVVK